MKLMTADMQPIAIIATDHDQELVAARIHDTKEPNAITFDFEIKKIRDEKPIPNTNPIKARKNNEPLLLSGSELLVLAIIL